MSISAIKKILKKDPIIHTFTPEQFVKDPEEIDENYSLHAETHMSIGETKKYLERFLPVFQKTRRHLWEELLVIMEKEKLVLWFICGKYVRKRRFFQFLPMCGSIFKIIFE